MDPEMPIRAIQVPIPTIPGTIFKEIPIGITGTTIPKGRDNPKARVKEKVMTKEMAKGKVKVRVVLHQGNA